MKVNDENRRIRIQDPDPNPDPDPLVKGMDPRIRIHPKMSWIRDTASDTANMAPSPLSVFVLSVEKVPGFNCSGSDGGMHTIVKKPDFLPFITVQYKKLQL